MQIATATAAHQKTIQIAFWAIAVAVASLAILRQVFDPADKTRCVSLLNHGSWLDMQRTQWQPKGCMLKTYNTQSTQDCIGSSRIVMIGDSVVRQLYYSIVKKVIPDANTDGDRHSDIFFRDPASGAAFEFYWDPVLNTTKTLNMLSPDLDMDAVEGKPRPSILLVGTGLWYLRYSDWTGGVEQWQQLMEKLIGQMTGPQSNRLGENLFISPISAVNTEKLSVERLRTLLPNDINNMNNFLREATQGSSITVPFSWNQMTETAASATKDGLHYVEKVMTAEADVMLNFLCNNRLGKAPPMASTCCYDYPNNQGIQTFMLALFMIWLPLGIYIQTYHRQHPVSSFFPSLPILRAMAVMAASVVYMFVADRTSLFGKGNKMYTTPSFAFLMFLSIVAGFMTLKKSEKDQPFLNRDQTDEWKGWMQIVILIYHYVGASSVSAIYNPVRMLVASYLFMTGFGHFVFFYKKADFGFVRVATILTRLNLLTILLTYTMNTTYLSYYFAPLVSFFYLIIYGMMYIGHSHNHNPLFIVSKVVITAILTAAFIQTPVILDSIFSFLHFLFGVTWSATEWRFRLQLDTWIVFVGALFAYGFIKAQELSISAHPQWNRFKQASLVFSVVGLLGYFIFEASLTKFEYNHYHPYVSWIPILSFIALRNSSAALRNTTSTLYTFIGKCSLETFIGQFHMWLAGDTKGLLVLSPWIEGTAAWCFNLVLSTIIFVIVANALSGATGELSEWLISGKEPKTNNRGLPSAIAQSQPSALVTANREKEPASALPLAVKRQSVMLSPIAVSAGATAGPATLKKLMEQSLLLETSSAAGSSSSVMVEDDTNHESHPLVEGTSFDSSKKSGGDHSKTNKKRQETVTLQIDTSDQGRRNAPIHSATSPTATSFKSLWDQPVWKVTIFFTVIWVLNYAST